MNQNLQIKIGQRGKIISFATGLDLTAASIVVRVKGTEDAAPRSYAATRSPSDPTCADLKIAAGMFDAVDTVAVDIVATFPGGKTIAADENITIEVIEL